MDSISYIRQQIRSVVDPMFLRLLQRLYDHPNATYVRDDVVPPTAITPVIQQYLETRGNILEITFPLGESMNIGSCVRLGADQKIYVAQTTVQEHAGTCIGILTRIDGTQGIVCCFGNVALPSVWTSLPPASFLFVSATGAVQPTVPTTGFIQRVGIATSVSSAFIYPLDKAIVLT